MSGSLSGRVALVTGGARGIGAAIVRAFVAAGARVVVADNGTSIDGRGEDADVARTFCSGIGDAVVPFTANVATPDGARSAVAAAQEAFGGLDIVVTCAAILRDALIFKANDEDAAAVLATNLGGAFAAIAAASPLLRENAKTKRGGDPYRWGRIVTITSTAGFYGNYGQAAYASAKAGLLGLMRVSALDLARSGITANAVAPFAATRVTETIVPQNDAQAAYKADALRVDAVHVARFVTFLASARAQWISGQLFGVRGRETFVFSQPRPAARGIVSAGVPEIDEYAAMVERELAPHFTPLETDLEAFATPPVI